jgi:transcriptional regulator with XRE-family HTH domain
MPGAVAHTAVPRMLSYLRENGGLQGKDIANIVDVSPATVSRWASGAATPTLHMQTLINDLRYVVDRLSDFYTADEARLWLNSRNELLEGQRAIDLIRARRTEDVLAVIDRLSAGVYL